MVSIGVIVEGVERWGGKQLGLLASGQEARRVRGNRMRAWDPETGSLPALSNRCLKALHVRAAVHNPVRAVYIRSPLLVFDGGHEHECTTMHLV